LGQLNPLFFEGVVLQKRSFSPRNFFFKDFGWGYHLIMFSSKIKGFSPRDLVGLPFTKSLSSQKNCSSKATSLKKLSMGFYFSFIYGKRKQLENLIEP
jgi:hypothetical protein